MRPTSDRPFKPATIAQLAEHRVDVEIGCDACGHCAVLPRAALEARLGAGFAVPAIAKRCRCSRCGAHAGWSRPNWPVLGVVANHETHESFGPAGSIGTTAGPLDA